MNGPLYFLAFINDLPECTSSDTRLLVDDGLLYKLIKFDKDAKLESVDSAKYLDVHVSQDMTWQTHVNRTASSSTLGFLRCNIHSCAQDVHERTYNMFVLPTLNYASVVWDHHPIGDVDQLE